jgi:RNA polymerase sigma-70 factor (ECF subfamily)
LDYIKHCAVRASVEGELIDIYNRDLALRIAGLEACNPVEIFSSEIMSKVNQTLQDLPKVTRTIFEMSRFECLTGKAISEQTGLSVKGVEYHITRALKALRKNLKDYLPIFLLLCI